MNELKTFNISKNISMTSLEIAEFTGKRHADILRDIQDEQAKIADISSEFTQRIFALSEYKDSTGRNLPMYRLNREGVLQLGARYDAKIRFALIQKLKELEEVALYGKAIPRSYPEALKALAETAEENERLAVENKAKDQIIKELKPKADYTDRILQSKGTVAVTVIAKDYGMSGMRFNHILNDLGVQYKQGSIWLLYRKYQDKGYTHSKAFDYTDSKGLQQTRMTTEWTQKGRLFLYNLLKENGYYPLIEIPAA